MAPIISVIAASLLLLAGTNAHFKLNSPESIGFSDDNESKSPCGGFTPDFSSDKVSDFHVQGEPVSLYLGHPQANWLFRVTLDSTGKGGWTRVLPIVQQSGLGDFCEVAVPAPAEYVGKKGIFGVIANAVDGLLYQCAVVNFVDGVGTVPSDCKNGTAKAEFVKDPTLEGALNGNTSTPSGSASSPQASHNGAPATVSMSNVYASGGLALLAYFACIHFNL